MKKTIPFFGILLLALGALTTLQSFTTNDDTQPVRCSSDEIHELRMETDSVYARAMNSLPTKSSLQRANSTETLTIPVVVHVFHDGDDYGTGSNIADNVIFDAIANLNACFAGEPWHTTTHSGVTHPYSDSNIEFCLASIDPDGNTTSGITRQNPDTLAGYTQSGMITTSLLAESSEQALKSLCYWPVQDYCNIYVVHKLNGGSSPLGFAYLPPTSAYYDGIVCYVNVFGFEEPWLLNSFNKNATLVHEMGHYLGLYHTFNFTSSCSTETNCNSQGDRCCDTPPTTGSVGCSPMLCPETMVENFMDYSNDNCMDRFSPDGVARMRTRLLTYRSELLDNGNCAALNGIDVAASNIFFPNQGNCTEFYEGVTFTMSSYSLDTITHVDVIYQVNSDSPLSFAWSGELTLGNPITVELPGLDIPYGQNTLKVWAYNPNFVPDVNPDNDLAEGNFVNEQGVNVSVIINFDALPYGVSWELYEADDQGNKVGFPIYVGDDYDNNMYSCTTLEVDFCLPEGNYIVIAEDLFGNGMHYWCQPDPSCILVEIDGEPVEDNSLCGGWSNGDNIPFTVSLGCPPLGDCPWDLDDDQVVGVSDVILILQVFGQFGECQAADFNNDGVVGVDDLLDVISIFGINCQTGMILEPDMPESIKALIQEKTGLNMGVTEIGSLNFSHSSPISINPYQIESMQDVLAVRYYDVSGKQITKDEVAYGIYIARIVMRDGTLETIKFYAQQ